MSSGVYVDGPERAAFESEFAEHCGRRHAVGVGSGTDAIALALEAMGVTGEVIVPALTFAATAAAVVRAGATPVFCDVGPEYTVTQSRVDAVTTAATDGVVPVHLFGSPCGRIRRSLVQDAAQAAGASDLPPGTAAFSFYPSKNLPSAGDAGAVVTDDPELAARVKSIGDHGRLDGSHVRVGTTSRLDEVQAAVLRVNLRMLPEWSARRREIADAYDDVLGSAAMPRPPGSCPHLYVIRPTDRDATAAAMSDMGVDTGVYYATPLHHQPAFARWARGPLPVAEQASETMLCLPIGPAMTDQQVETVQRAIQEAMT
jgi:dTDP-4-amino-4,6-dideoxygalactose transaminase